MTEHPDLSKLPRGQREWRALIESLQQIDDRAERYFLELKSELDLTRKEHRAKVAKFILGAANRAPDRAKRRFDGYALMVIGVEFGQAKGVGPFEAKDLETSVAGFVGTDEPAWDFERIPLDDDKDVIVIIVHPPTGKQIWTCLKDGPDGLHDGDIFIRADGETRQAKGQEVRDLTSRASQFRPDVDLDVGIEGTVNAVSYSRVPFEERAAFMAANLRSAARVRNHDQPDTRKRIAPELRMPAAYTNHFSRAENRSRGEYEAEISDWEAEYVASCTNIVDSLAGAFFARSAIRITNRTKRFLNDVRVILHLDGPVRAIDVVSDDTDFLFDLPSAPRTWGPYQHYPGIMGAAAGYSSNRTWTPAINVVSYRNGGSVDLTFTLSDLRPLESHTTDDDEFLLVIEGCNETEVRGTWQATAQGIDDVFEGTMEVSVSQTPDLTQAIERLLASDGNDDVSDLM